MYQTPHIFAEIPQGGFNNFLFLPFFEVLNQILEPKLVDGIPLFVRLRAYIHLAEKCDLMPVGVAFTDNVKFGCNTRFLMEDSMKMQEEIASWTCS